MKAYRGKRVFGLDLMRAVAIMLVVFSHIYWIIPNSQGVIIDLMGIAGVLGVEVFFVLSGFLIGRIVYRLYVSEDFNFKSLSFFWVRRWFRTLPNYYLALLLNIVVILFIGSRLPEGLWKYFVFVQNFASEMPSFFMESWSLSIEEFAYIIGPLLLYATLFIKTNLSKSKQFFLVTLFVILVFILTKWIYALNDDMRSMTKWNSGLKAVLIYRIDAIYYGVLAAYISLIMPQLWKRVRRITFVFGCLLLLGLNIGIPMKFIFIESYPIFWNLFYLPLNSIAIMLMLPFCSQWKNAPQLISVPITFISLISYAIYVLHYSIILQLLKYKLPTENLPRFDIVVYIVVYICLTVLCSYVLYRCFEKPITDLRDSKRVRCYFNRTN